MEPQLQQALLTASSSDQATHAILQVYTQVHYETYRRRPFCARSGCCCRFEQFGHRLYLTTLELATFQRQFRLLKPLPHRLLQSIRNWTGDGCPFQVANLCGVHAIRPLGCRLFFCDTTAIQWQHELYERFHHQIKRLHEQLQIPYFYLEWRQALRAAGMPSLP